MYLPFLISFFDEASNFGNRILTNQQPKLVIRNCQWNCMFNALLAALHKSKVSK